MPKLSLPKSVLAGFVPLIASLAVYGQAHADAGISQGHTFNSSSTATTLHNFPEGHTFPVPSINGKPGYEVMRSKNCEKNAITRLVIKTTAIADAFGSNSSADVETLVVCTINEDQSAKLSDVLGYSTPQFENTPFYLVLGSQSSATGKPLTGDVAIALIKNTEAAGGFKPGIAIMADGQPIVVGQIANLPKPNSERAGALAQIIQEADSQDSGEIELVSAQPDSSLARQIQLLPNQVAASTTPSVTVDTVTVAPIRLAGADPVPTIGDKSADVGHSTQPQATSVTYEASAAANVATGRPSPNIHKEGAAKYAMGQTPPGINQNGEIALSFQHDTDQDVRVDEPPNPTGQSTQPKQIASSNHHRSFFHKSIDFVRHPHKWFAWLPIHHHPQSPPAYHDDGTSKPIDFHSAIIATGDVPIDLAPQRLGIVGGNNILLRQTDGCYEKSHAGLSTQDMACMTLAQKQASGYLPKPATSLSFLSQFCKDFWRKDNFYQPTNFNASGTAAVIAVGANGSGHPSANDNVTTLQKVMQTWNKAAQDATAVASNGKIRPAQASFRAFSKALHTGLAENADNATVIFAAVQDQLSTVITADYKQSYRDRVYYHTLQEFANSAASMTDRIKAAQIFAYIAANATDRSKVGKFARQALASLASPVPRRLAA